MSKEYFLQRLEYLLSDVPQEEREAALSYYRDYFEEAGAEKEQEVLNSIGSPEKVSSEIKSRFFCHSRYYWSDIRGVRWSDRPGRRRLCCVRGAVCDRNQPYCWRNSKFLKYPGGADVHLSWFLSSGGSDACGSFYKVGSFDSDSVSVQVGSGSCTQML